MAGPAGKVVRSPKNSTSTPCALEVPVAQEADQQPFAQGPQDGAPESRPSGTMVRPMAWRWAMNHSKSSGGSITSATAVIG